MCLARSFDCVPNATRCLCVPLPPRYYDYYYIKLQHHSRSLYIKGSDMMHKCRVHSIAFLCSTPSQVQFQLHHITTITLLYTTCNHRLKSHFFLKKRKSKERDAMMPLSCPLCGLIILWELSGGAVRERDEQQQNIIIIRGK